ncbi:hypothetical protein GCM10008967_28760 [Bacillus carboniphilus]|uniref:SLH domain-containing protein n=1 Tax=Bacillus carboniphilus TaxID=86663 RepID=A0ABP3G6Y6_9BACI
MVKRSLVLLLVFLLSFGSAVYGMTPSLMQEKPNLSKEELTPDVDPNEKVRVIVELSEEPTIMYAQKKGMSFKDLNDTTKEQLETEALTKQLEVQSDINTVVKDIEYLNQFTTVVNGFSAEVAYSDLEKITKIPNVKGVHIVNEYQRPEITPDMTFSKELVDAQRAWTDYGYKGEGMVVGIIDTGIDPSHRDMVLTNPSEAKYNETEINSLIESEELKGKFYTAKVPYGYNYMDDNNTILDLGSGASMHGMHVAGTVGANGDEENGGIKGVAPEAQLLALKVFGNNPEMPSTFSDIIIKAIDDAIKLEADVLNLSLGATAGFVDENDPEQQAVKRAVDNGILVSISAGNSALFGDGYFYPYVSNPDYGVSGSPGVSYDSLQVASLENSYMPVDSLNYAIMEAEDIEILDETSTEVSEDTQEEVADTDLEGGSSSDLDELVTGEESGAGEEEPGTGEEEPSVIEEGSAPFLSASAVHPNEYVQKTFEIVHAGLGHPHQFPEDTAGKYALIQRGELPFVDKALNAQAAGAVGVIIYNNDGGIVNMATDPAITIPQLFMLKDDGDKLAAALGEGKVVLINFAGESTTIQNPSAGTMSTFSSWGLTPNLDFKPEITAPGGQIYSTLNNDQYGLMSGTSMAAPHVSGGSALALQRVDEEFGVSGFDRVLMAKNLLMNTALPIVDANGDGSIYVSPRRQGAGLMQLHAALSTPVVVTEQETNEAKVALREITEDSVSFTLTATNYSDEDVSYDVATNLQTDSPVNAGVLVVAPNLVSSLDIPGAAITVNGEESPTIGIPAGSTVSIDVTIDFSGVLADLDAIFTNGYWVDGFIRFVDPTDTHPSLVVPMSGFKGNWDDAPIFDLPTWDPMTYYGYTEMLYESEGSFYFLGYDLDENLDPNNIAISPNGDGIQDNALPILSFLRNAKELQINVLDAEGNHLRTLRTESNVRKNYSTILSTPYSLVPARVWDGKINKEVAEDGQYYIQLKAKIDFEGAEWQSLELPVKVDTAKPTVTASFSEETQSISLEATDNDGGSGLFYWDVWVDGSSVLPAPLSPSVTDYHFDKTVKANESVEIVVFDFAGNYYFETLKESVDQEVPEIHVTSPEYLETLNSKMFEVSGYINDKSDIAELLVNGEAVENLYPMGNDTYFSKTVQYEADGVYNIIVKATDSAGNELSVAQKVIVDSTTPTIELLTRNIPNFVSANGSNPTIDVKVADNYDEVRLYLNDSEVYAHEFAEPFEMRAFEATVEDIELPLVTGENTFTLKVTDLAGHVVETEEIVINKAAPPSGGSVTPPAPSQPDNNGDVDSDVEDAIGESQEEIEVELPNADDSGKVTAEIGTDTFKKVAESKKPLVLNSEGASLKLPAGVVDELSKATKDKVKVSLTPVDESNVPLTDGQKLKSKVLDFTISLVSGSKETKVSSFSEPLQLSFSVEGEPFGDKRKAAAYYLNEDTNDWEYVGGKVEGDRLVFKTRHFSKYAVIENSKTFTDIQNAWAKDEIEVLASRSIISGKTEDSFAPEDKLTRAEFAVLLSRALNLPTEQYQGTFTDVTEGKKWAYAGIEAAHRAGIVAGFEDGSYNPDAKISREEMAVMIVRAVEYQNSTLLEDLDPSTQFVDEGKIGTFAFDAIYQANALGIISGRAGNVFDPKTNTTRAEAAAMLYRLLNTLGEL